jgi:hypothetical protein
MIPNNDSSANCDIKESFKCIEEYIDSNFEFVPFSEENIWVTNVSNDEAGATIMGTRYFKKTTLVSPNGWELFEERSFQPSWVSVVGESNAIYEVMPLLMSDDIDRAFSNATFGL